MWAIQWPSPDRRRSASAPHGYPAPGRAERITFLLQSARGRRRLDGPPPPLETAQELFPMGRSSVVVPVGDCCGTRVRRSAYFGRRCFFFQGILFGGGAAPDF